MPAATNPHAAAAAWHPDGIDRPLIDGWQRGFPLVERPFAVIADALATTEADVIGRLQALQARGAVSRIGGVWAPGAGGAAMLCAYAVPPARLDEAAARVSAMPGVNHNYEREHDWSLWFVVTGSDAAAIHRTVDALDAGLALQALRLPMRRAYRIDLGFAMFDAGAAGMPPTTGAPACPAAPPAGPPRAAPPVEPADRPLAAWLERGLPIVPQPWAAASAALGRPGGDLRATVARWLAAGTLRRLGCIVRHHELGWCHNAMTVFDVPDDRVDAHGARLAGQPGVTLAYRRLRAPGWAFNLYAMVHGTDRAAVQRRVDAATQAAGLAGVPRAVLFSRRRFKQTGGAYFQDSPAPALRAGAEGAHHVPA